MLNKGKKHNELENVEQVLTSSEAFIEKYQKQILYVVGTIVMVVIIILAFRNFYLKPREIEAENEMYKAQTYFNTDSFKIALVGKANEFIGFKEIISEYGITSSGNLAAAYAGICYYKLGEYDNAIKNLTQFDGEDEYFTTSITGLIGDSYVELGETKKAVSYFEKAADMNNEVLSPVYLKKAGFVYESLNQPEKALKLYIKIKDNFPKSNEAADIEKYIARIQK
ncbi:MAG: tetratricopeptide repeat protein [Paludibacter sp.]|nr:tetratricopeptide repeat protein [Paludibacter sp.]